MANCNCTPNEFPFHCSRYNETMDHAAYSTCRGENGLLQKIKQEKALLRKLRQKNQCGHLGPDSANTDIRRCAIYGQCTLAFKDNSIQSCDMCSDHTAITHLLELPTVMRDHFVPFDTGKGSGSDDSCETNCDVACCNFNTEVCEMVEPSECNDEDEYAFDPQYDCSDIDCSSIICCDNNEIFDCGIPISSCINTTGGPATPLPPDPTPEDCQPGDLCPIQQPP